MYTKQCKSFYTRLSIQKVNLQNTNNCTSVKYEYEFHFGIKEQTSWIPVEHQIKETQKKLKNRKFCKEKDQQKR